MLPALSRTCAVTKVSPRGKCSSLPSTLMVQYCRVDVPGCTKDGLPAPFRVHGN